MGSNEREMILNAWRIEIANRLMADDREQAALMCRLTDVVVGFTERVLRADEDDVEMRVAQALADLPDAPCSEPEAEQPSLPPSDEPDEQPDDQEQSTEDYDSTYKEDSNEYRRTRRASTRTKKSPRTTRTDEPAGSSRVWHSTTFKPPARQPPPSGHFYDETPKVFSRGGKPARTSPFLLITCGKWPKLPNQNLRMYRFLTQIPPEIQKILEETGGIHSSLRSVVIAPRTAWMRNHGKAIPDLQALFEFVHREAPKATIKICGFYTPPFKWPNDLTCARRFNDDLKGACRPYAFVEFVDLDQLAHVPPASVLRTPPPCRRLAPSPPSSNGWSDKRTADPHRPL
ncbi:hypothetical protein M3Y99_01151700 [Aphelenchoides fujianensis]|nr:hypothetical protein M3Y99_01151700 [Aphelenchoides fujianensis]